MKHLLYILLLLLSTRALAYEVSGDVGFEFRNYTEDDSDNSLTGKVEFSKSWDSDRKVISVIPYGRLSTLDDERSHIDLREASFVGSYGDWEIRAGVSKVFWGVTESQHLVDVINQTDLVENIDGEAKLGQPMINPTYSSDYGNFSYYLLPYFRERTFAGIDGRFRPTPPVNTNRPLYQDSDEEAHIDHAFRYSHYIGEFEFGVSYFKGTDREPLLVIDNSDLVPYYIQSEQVGLDFQYIVEALLLKFEGIWKSRESIGEYAATTAGFEYTFSNVYKGMDIGMLLEHLYDERGTSGGAIFDDHSFGGVRAAWNDELGTELLAGVLIDNESGNTNTFRLETSRRINNNWKWAIEANLILDTETGEPLDSFKEDDYVQATLSYYF